MHTRKLLLSLIYIYRLTAYKVSVTNQTDIELSVTYFESPGAYRLGQKSASVLQIGIWLFVNRHGTVHIVLEVLVVCGTSGYGAV